MNVTLTVNGRSVTEDVDPRTYLADFLRENLGMTGTKVGCDTCQCGSCTILLDGNSVKSCAVLAVQAAGSDVKTVESLAADGRLNALQQSFMEMHGVQCGFCTPGML